MTQKDQLRLIFLCVGLLVVVVVMQKASQPEFWHWLLPPEAPATSNEPEQTVIRMAVQSAEDNPPPQTDLLTAIPIFLTEEEKANIKDDHVGIRQSESDLYYKILTEIKQVDPTALQLEAASHTPAPNYQLLMAETEQWRGELVTLEGKAKRIVVSNQKEQPENLQTLYDVWLITPDSGSMPYHVVCTTLPPNCPTGDAINIPVRVTGCLFKRQGYSAEGGLRMTPLILASQLEHVSTDSQLGQRLQTMVPMMTLLAIVLGSFMLFTLWKMISKTDPIKRARPKFMSEAEPPPDFTGLEESDKTDQGESS